MKKIAVWIAVLAVIIGAVVWHNTHAPTESSGKRKVYAVLALTGFQARAGQEMKKAFDAFITEHPNLPFSLVYVDSEGDPSKALSAVMHATLSEENPLVIVGITAVAGSVIPKIAREDGFSIFIAGLRTQEIAKNKNYQSMTLGEEDGFSLQSRYMAKKYKQIAVIHSEEEYAVSAARFFAEKYKAGGGKILGTFDFSGKDPDTRATVMKALATNPEAIFVTGGFTVAYKNLFKELRNYGFKVEIVADAVFSYPSFHENLGIPYDGIVFPTVDLALENPLTETGKELKAFALRNNLSQDLLLSFTTNALMSLEKILSENLPITSETFYKELKEMNNATFLPDGNCFYNLVLATYKNGQIVPVEEETP